MSEPVALSEDGGMSHDTYVYKDGYHYTWLCQECGAKGTRHRRRMDADDEANAHDATDQPADTSR